MAESISIFKKFTTTQVNTDLLRSTDIYNLIANKSSRHYANLLDRQEKINMDVTILFDSDNQVEMRYEYGVENTQMIEGGGTIFNSGRNDFAQLIIKNIGSGTLIMTLY